MDTKLNKAVKARYAKPTLSRYGSIAMLTQTGSGPGAEYVNGKLVGQHQRKCGASSCDIHSG